MLYANFEHIVPFIKHGTKLRKIIIQDFDIADFLKDMHEDREDSRYEDYIKDNTNEATSGEQPIIINLSVLNIERAKLPNAEMITLYVDEKVYSATKLARRE